MVGNPKAPAQRLQALLLCRDAHVLTVLNRGLDDLEIETRICLDPRPAPGVLEDEILDLVIIDWDDDRHALDLLKMLRASGRNRHAATLAIVRTREAMQEALNKAVHFVTYAPRSVDEAARSLRPVFGFLQSKRRGSFRSPVRISASIRTDTGISGKATIVDLSEGGASISSAQVLPVGTVVQLGFALPPGNLVHATGKVCWSGTNGPAGIRFTYIPQPERELLRRWLTQMEEKATPKAEVVNVSRFRMTAAPAVG